MAKCYHRDITFEDPAFGILEGERAAKMWEMLLNRSKGTLKVSFHNVEATGERGSASWVAEYEFGKKRRKVVNKVSAEFRFQDGKIIEHRDSFDLWRWAIQAMGFTGLLLGWTAFFRKRLQATTNKQLDKYIERN